MTLVIVIGRGHSGTRMLAHLLQASGCYMGEWLNSKGDLLPAAPMYDACREIGAHIDLLGPGSWDFARVTSASPTERFEELVRKFSDRVAMRSDRQFRGWKLPETTLALPWIISMFPDAHYVHVTRDPRDTVLQPHMTDDLGAFGVPTVSTDVPFVAALESWKYHIDLVEATPRPARFIELRLSDLIRDHDRAIRGLEAFLGSELARVPVRPETIGRWKTEPALLHALSLDRMAWVSEYLANGHDGGK